MILLRQITRFFLFIVVCLTVPLAQVVMRHIDRRDPYKMARLWHRLCLRMLRIRIIQTGAPAEGRIVFLSNHASYLDIPVLGSIIPARFVSRQGIRDWPVFGHLAVLQDTIFIDNSSKFSAIKSARRSIQAALATGERLIIFPEGTNTIGNVVLPFHRGVMHGLPAHEYSVQPVAIRTRSVNGASPHSVDDFNIYGWGDIGFLPHFWRVLAQKSIDIEVIFLPSVPMADDILDGLAIERAGMAVKTQVEQNLVLTVQSP